MKTMIHRLLPGVLAALLLAGCGRGAAPAGSAGSADGSELVDISQIVEVAEDVQLPDDAYVDTAEMELLDLEDEAVALASSPAAVSTALTPVASGTQVQKTSKATIDYSNAKDGYVMVQYTASTTKRLKVQVTGPSYATNKTQYTYNLTANQWVTFCLSDGNGSYKVSVFENVQDTKYANVCSVTFNVTLANEFGPFLYSNQYVDYTAAPKTTQKAAELVNGLTDPLKKVEAVYKYVIENMTYDNQLAATVQSGYLPVLDTVLDKKSGICFDYAALMAGMLRSQGVPCQLVVGYAGTAYHAWINVWSDETGWINGAVYFDGTAWHRMDPTFASSSKQSAAIMAYIGDGKNYTEKYLY